VITILQTTDGTKLTKTFTKEASGEITKSSYQQSYLFNAIEHDVSNIFELSEVLSEIEAADNLCVIRGEVKPDCTAINVKRRLHGHDAVFQERAQGCSWLMIDFDSIMVPASVEPSQRLAYLVDLLPEWFKGATYHYQWSASAGRDGWKTLSAHLWFWLDQPWRSEIIRERIKYENWEGVDASAFDAVHIHYTAAPIFVNMADPLEVPRSGLVQGVTDVVSLPDFIKPVQPFVPRSKTENGDYFQRKFESMLADIGPNFHVPIRSAIFFYMNNAPEVDTSFLKQELLTAIAMAPAGRSPKHQYDATYIQRSIHGAMQKT